MNMKPVGWAYRSVYAKNARGPWLFARVVPLPDEARGQTYTVEVCPIYAPVEVDGFLSPQPMPPHDTTWAYAENAIPTPEPDCQEFAHWREACPNCGGEVHLISRTCFGSDPHNTYGCSAYCGWRGRSGLAHGSPKFIHDDALHELQKADQP